MKRVHGFISIVAGVAVALSSVSTVLGAPTESVLYSFKAEPDGDQPFSEVIKDSAGNLYGTTLRGGLYGGCHGVGCGVVFKLSPDGNETLLYTFKGGTDGDTPRAGLVMDGSGNLYGTTYEGGRRAGEVGCGHYGCGTVFKLSPDGSEVVLHSFHGRNDGAHPSASLLLDSEGNLFGTTGDGRIPACNDGLGCGTVFKLAPDGTLTTLHSFTGGADGNTPFGGVIKDREGNLYGTTQHGGDDSCDCGTVFKIAPDGKKTVLHSFTHSDGGDPLSTLIRDRAGNLYGTTNQGPGFDCSGVGCGTVFKIAKNNQFTVLHAFLGPENNDGQWPMGNLTLDKAGNLYGTTTEGGTGICAGGCGTVFKITPDGFESVLYSFQGIDGDRPGGVFEDKKGRLFGTTLTGGANGHGIVFGLIE